MKKFFKKFLLVLTLCTASLTASAKEIDVVMKITINAPSDWDFLKKTFNVKKDFTPELVNIKTLNTYALGEFFMAKCQYDEKDSLKYSTTIPCYYYPIRSRDCFYCIPSLARLIVPNDAKCAYAGSWVITIDPETFLFSRIELVDEYDQAKEWVQKNYGTQKQLVRAQIIQFDEEEKEKAKKGE